MDEGEILSGVAGNVGFADYYAAYRKLQGVPSSAQHKVKIAILSSFTIEPFGAVLAVACRKAGIFADVMTADFNQYAQQALDENSRLYAFKPDIILFFLDAETLFGDSYHFPYRKDADGRRKQVAYHSELLQSLLAHIRKHLSSIVVLNTLDVPFHSVLGLLEGKVEYGTAQMVRDFNAQMFELASKDAGTYVFDLDSWAALHGKRSVFDAKMKHLARMHLSTEFYPDLAHYYVRYAKALKGLARKCIVLDLDNTLWGGVAGEEGMDGIALGEEAPGNAFVEFQKVLLSFYERGVLLAINSKNNPEDAWDIIDNHPGMVLRRDNFAAYRINWQDKVLNMRELAAELNIGLQSFVFLDDSPEERFLVRRELPEVHVPDLPSDPSLFASFLKALGEFDTLQLTEEDRLRSVMYAQKKKVEELQHQFTDMAGFLKALQLQCRVLPADESSLPRIAQLTQKTNQFNLTTRRYSLEDIRAFVSSGKAAVHAYSVSDRFGEQGIVGVTIVKKQGDGCYIDTFLLSCRVLGREIEKVMLGTIMQDARKMGASAVYGEYIPTQKNAIVNGFYAGNGFAAVSEADGAAKFSFSLSREFPMPECVEVVHVA